MGSAGGRGEVGEGAERDKSPGIKPGRKFSEGTRRGGSEGREENCPSSLFILSHPELRLELKASTDKLNGLQIQNVPGHPVVLLDLGMNASSKGAAGDSTKWEHTKLSSRLK